MTIGRQLSFFSTETEFKLIFRVEHFCQLGGEHSGKETFFRWIVPVANGSTQFNKKV